MSGKKLTLTDADLDALKHMPEGWFSAADLPHTVRCPRARCERLEARGKLESRVVGTVPWLFTEFKKTV